MYKLSVVFLALGFVACEGSRPELEALKTNFANLEQQKEQTERERARLLEERDALEAKNQSWLAKEQEWNTQNTLSERQQQQLQDNLSDLLVHFKEEARSWEKQLTAQHQALNLEKSEKAALETRLNTKISELNALHSNATKSASKKQMGLKKEVDALTAQVAEAKAREEKLKAEIAQSNEQLQLTQDALARSQASHDALEATRQDESVRCDEAKLALQSESDTRHSRIKDLEGQLSREQDEKNMLSLRFIEKQEELAGVKAQHTADKNAASGVQKELNRQKAALEGEVTQLKGQITALNSQIAQTQKALADAKSSHQSESTTLQGRIQDLELNLGAVRTQMAHLESNLQKEQEEKNALSLRFIEKQEELAGVKAQHAQDADAAQNQKAKLESEVATLKVELANVNQKIALTEKNLVSTQDELRLGQLALGEAQALAAACDLSNGQLNHALAELSEKHVWQTGNYTMLWEELGKQRAIWQEDAQGYRGELARLHTTKDQLLSVQKSQSELMKNMNGFSQTLLQKLQFETAVGLQAQSELNEAHVQVANVDFNAEYEAHLTAALQQEIQALQKQRDHSVQELSALAQTLNATGQETGQLKKALEDALASKAADGERLSEIPELKAQVEQLKGEIRRLETAGESAFQEQDSFKRRSRDFINSLGQDRFGAKKTSELLAKLNELADPERLVEVLDIKHELPVPLPVVLHHAPRLEQPRQFFVAGGPGRAQDSTRFLLATDDESIVAEVLEKNGQMSFDSYRFELPKDVPVLYLGNGVYILPKRLLHPDFLNQRVDQILRCNYFVHNGEISGFDNYVQAVATQERSEYEDANRTLRFWEEALKVQ